MNLHKLTTKELKALLKQFSIVSLSLNEVILKQQIEDEILSRSLK